MIASVINQVEKGYIPDRFIRMGIRRLLTKRLKDLENGYLRNETEYLDAIISKINNGPIALVPEKANEEHYEVPAEFFETVLGPNLKYSSAFFKYDNMNLERAEEEMLETTCQRAGLENGMDILELGCGWGSLTLWMARQFPQSRITAVSNSASQKAFILKKAGERNLKNIDIITMDMNYFEAQKQFDRIVSVEMFEHMNNVPQLLKRIAEWLKPEGRLFVHIFSHKKYPYFFETTGASNWMGRYFFTGGMMPSDDLYYNFQDDLKIIGHWKVNGTHYHKTAEMWLQNLDKNKDKILKIFQLNYGEKEASIWLQRWRIFFMSCAELWGFDNGNEWGVSHYLFKKHSSSSYSS